WFQTTVLLLQDKELREKFFKIYNNSFHSVETPLAVITHAPCRNIYLGKNDDISLKFQRNLSMPKYENDIRTIDEKLADRDAFFSFIKEDASDTDKYHLFGHTMINEVFKLKNKICLDTGCVVGGKLSCAIFNEGNLTFKSYDSIGYKKYEKLYPYFV
ncbi:MAG: hypothetical protein ABIP51_16880, partial [Bacteroidia bacterium]